MHAGLTLHSVVRLNFKLSEDDAGLIVHDKGGGHRLINTPIQYRHAAPGNEADGVAVPLAILSGAAFAVTAGLAVDLLGPD